jgi:beta-glucanase (GH16 family)
VPPPTPVGQQSGWSLIFRDEFEGTALDTSKWTTCYWWDWNNQGCTNSGNNELEWYQPDEVLVSDGSVHLRAQQQSVVASDGKTFQFTSGMISSGRNREDPAPAGLVFQYGFVEIKAKLPSGQGVWPAFWMLPNDNQSKPEIDIMEVLGDAPDTVHMSLHYLKENGSVGRETKFWAGPDFSSDWHTFALDWEPNLMVWYIDGIERWRYSNPTNIPNQPMYLLMNLAVGGDWPGAPDSTTIFPSYYEIDYVRAWKHE